MKSRTLITVIAIAVLTALTIPTGLAAQDAAQVKPAQHHHYQLIDLGTLGGPHSYGSVNGDGFSLLNNSGVVASYADLNLPDPNQAYGCYDADCYQAHAFRWKDGVMTDLGALPLNNNSAAASINARGWMTGQSQSDQIDPVVGIREYRAVLWKDGQIIDLGTLGNGTESLGIYINDANQVIGFSTVDTTSDPIGFFGFPTHTFIWANGSKTDIGTLGGADTVAGASCTNPPEGIVVGGSTTTTTINPDTGLPTAEPFLWDHGKMTGLGTLGGTNGFAQCANRRGQIIGASSLASNPAACNTGSPGCHAFLWEHGVMTDLGTLGGDISEAIWLNEAGEIAGSADLPGGQLHDAVLWRHGKIHDLGTVPGDPCSRGRAINKRGQVVGGSSDCHNFLHAFLWDNGGPMIDLNTLIQPGTGYQLTSAFNINDRGEILAKAAPLGFTPNDDADLGHLALLIPCDDDHPDVDGCDYSMVDASTAAAAATQAPATKVPSPFIQGNPALRGAMNPVLRRFGGRLGPWYRGMGAETPALKPTNAPPAGITTQTTTEGAPEESPSCSQGSDEQSGAEQAKPPMADNRLDEPLFRKEQPSVCGAKYLCSSHVRYCRFCRVCYLGGFNLTCWDLQYHRTCSTGCRR